MSTSSHSCRGGSPRRRINWRRLAVVWFTVSVLLASVSKQATGPGRALFDGRDLLHVLVPRGDPHEARTIELLIDQHRSDAGADPQQVQIHHYQIHPGAQAIGLTHGKPAPTSEVRSARGFVTMRIDVTKGLTDFLAQTRHLSWLEVRGSEVWAGGWNWTDVPGEPLDFEDVSVTQRGYLQPLSPAATRALINSAFGHLIPW